ncbi:MAG: hypothetical protein MJZ73_03355 [Bacteroidaceae bacterium]|nr:hypothetical protein [Bacteroidaceae bacterium]
MILLLYNSEEIETIRLTVGIRNRSLVKIQYGITAVNETENIEPMVNEKKKHLTRSEMLGASVRRTAMSTHVG